MSKDLEALDKAKIYDVYCIDADIDQAQAEIRQYRIIDGCG